MAATGLIYTVAGNGTEGFSGDGGPATAASLSNPSGVAVDANGNAYISDSGNSRIRKVAAGTGIITTYAGNGTADYTGDNVAATATSLYFPNGVAVDAAGNLFIADTGNDRIRRVAVASGIITTVAGSDFVGFGGDGGPATSAQLLLPYDVSVDAVGNLYIADRNNFRIRRVDVTGIISTIAGNGSPYFNGENLPALETSLYSPHGVTVDSTGTVFIADTINYRIRSFVPGPVVFPQTITFPPFAVRTYLAGEILTVSATASSGLPVTLTSLTTPVCTLAGTTLTLVADGICTIAANQPGNTTYSAAPQVTQSLAVGAPPTGPAVFTFIDQVNVAPGRMITSNTITVTGIGTSLPISVSGGMYSVGCNGVFTAAPNTVANGQTVCVSHTSSTSPGASTDTLLAIGTTTDTFTSTTAATSTAGIVTGYYQAILRRNPEAGAVASWEGHATRMQSLGADPIETWRVMALGFFNSPEYAAFNRLDTEFIVDIYNAFFGRPPDVPGLAHWMGQIALGMPREALLLSCMFSPEFTTYIQTLFATTATRPEKALVVDFYRGFLGRLPDSIGFQFWADRFRVAQCTSAAAVTAEADAISRAFLESPEYLARSRTNIAYVTDLYNGFMRRGGELLGFDYWVAQLDSAALTREQLRRNFLGSTEFQARVNAAAAAGCY